MLKKKVGSSEETVDGSGAAVPGVSRDLLYGFVILLFGCDERSQFLCLQLVWQKTHTSISKCRLITRPCAFKEECENVNNPITVCYLQIW